MGGVGEKCNSNISSVVIFFNIRIKTLLTAHQGFSLSRIPPKSIESTAKYRVEFVSNHA